MATIKTLLGNVKGKDGRGYEEVTLYDGDCSACINWNVISADSPMMELSDSIENYKSIRIEFISHDTRNSSGGLVVTAATYSVNFIKSYYTYSCLGCSTGYGNNYSSQVFGFYDSKHLALTWENYSGWAHNMSHITVTGIRDRVSDAEKNFNKYSTTEEVVGTWIDKKTIYRKVMKFPVIKHDMTVLTNVDHIINVSGYFNWNGAMQHQYSFPYNDNDIATWIGVDNNIVKIYTNYTNDTLINLVLCLEYTKTT